MRLAKITQPTGEDWYVNPAHVLMVIPDGKPPTTLIIFNELKERSVTSKSSVADVVKEIDDAMRPR